MQSLITLVESALMLTLAHWLFVIMPTTNFAVCTWMVDLVFLFLFLFLDVVFLTLIRRCFYYLWYFKSYICCNYSKQHNSCFLTCTLCVQSYLPRYFLFSCSYLLIFPSLCVIIHDFQIKGSQKYKTEVIAGGIDKAGKQDGKPNESLFNYPTGIVVH